MCIYNLTPTHTDTHIAACGIAFYVFNMLKTHVLLLITGMYIYMLYIYIHIYNAQRTAAFQDSLATFPSISSRL